MSEDIFSIGELFEQVQLQKVFPDGKTFVDCTPRSSLASIQKKYEEEKIEAGFHLSQFVHNHFDLPATHTATYVSVKNRPIEEHIRLLWDDLTRKPGEGEPSLIPLPYPYIVPGGRFREIFYWDSYFTMLGLQVSGRIDLVQNMVDNFSYLIDTFGYIPNGNRTYFLGRSQPPFFASMVKLLDEETNGKSLVKYLPQLLKEYNFWMKGAEQLNGGNTSVHRVVQMPDGNVLNRYWDELDTPRPESFREDIELGRNVKDQSKLYRNLRAACESGWDFSSRWFRDASDFTSIHATEIIPVDLNCLLYNLESTIVEAYRLSNGAYTEKYEIAANRRKEAINKYCWNKKYGYYFDFDFVVSEQKESVTLAGTFPLFFEIASFEQAKLVVDKATLQLLCSYGLQTTSFPTHQQWDAPNGWAPLQWVAIKGFLNYGHSEIAGLIARRWMSINETVYMKEGKMMEKYNVVSSDLGAGGGEYEAQDGFGWTNGVYLALKKRFI